MKTVRESLDALIRIMKEEPYYKEYRRLEEKLQMNPELKMKVNEFRRRRYDLQKEDDVYEAVDRLGQEFHDLLKNRTVSDYLDAEVAVCRLVQQVLREINEGIEIDVPQ